MNKKWFRLLACLLALLLLVSLCACGDEDDEDDKDDRRDKTSQVEVIVDKSYRVPNFVGMDYNEEVLKMDNIGQYNIRLEQAYNAEYPAGAVFKQEPVANTEITKSTTVTLYISLGSKKETVPSMVPGEKPNDVRNRLERKGFKVKEVAESHATIELGMAIRTDPEPGSSADYGSEVKLYVSSGKPEEDPIDMPDVLHMSKDDAEHKLVLAGFDQTKFTYEEVNSDAPKGTVVGVSHDHRQNWYPNTNFKLLISSGKAPVKYTIPNLIGNNFYEVQNQKIDGKFVVYCAAQERNEAPAGTILRQTPEAGTTTEQTGTVISVVISSGPNDTVEMPDLTYGWTEANAKQLLEALGLKVKIVKIYVSDQDYGYVDRTDPIAGAIVEKGDTVTLYVSYAE